jgi:DNA-binding transcriptional LysR family regulator
VKDLPINVLRTFVTIVERGGFTQAAIHLGMTQPTVSQQLKKLEDLVDSPLMNRGQRNLELTAAGEKILDYARRILMLNDEAVSQLLTPIVSGQLRLGIPHEFTTSILPRIVGAFAQVHPDVVVEVDCELSKTLLANCDDYDLVIALHEKPGKNTGLRLRKEPLAWVASLDFQYEPDRELQVVAAPEPCIYRANLERVLKKHKPGWALRLTSTSYGAVCAAVSTGMGVTVLARSVVPDDLKVVELTGLPDLGTLDLRIHYERANASIAAKSFVEFAQTRLVAM